MGVTKKLSIEDYWTTTGVSATHFIGEAMSQDLFQLILSNLQCQCLTGSHPKYPDPQHDAVFCLCPFIDMLNKNYSAVYKVGESLSINKACCAYKGKIHFHQ